MSLLAGDMLEALHREVTEPPQSRQKPAESCSSPGVLGLVIIQRLQPSGSSSQLALGTRALS